MKDILSQEEIDALLSNVDTQDISANGAANDAQPFDLASRRHIRRESLPGLERLNQRFAEQFRASLSRLLGRPTEIIPQSLQFSSYGAYQHSLYIPSSLSLLRLAGLGGAAMIMADARLIFRLLDMLFGGSGRGSAVDGRDFSVAEQRLIERFSRLLIDDLNAAWSPLLNLQCEVVSREVNPVMAVIAGSADPVLVSRFVVDSEGTGGEFHLVFPMSCLEPVRNTLMRTDLLDRSFSDDPLWRRSIRSAVMDTRVSTHCTLAEKNISLRTLTQMQAGDVIQLGHQNQAVLKAAGMPLYRASLGIINNKLALKLNESL